MKNRVFPQFVFVAVTSLIGLMSQGVLANEPAKAAKEAKKIDLVKAEQISTQQCAACHNADGNSAIPTNPKLAGQHAAYLYKQLSNFKVAAGAKEAERPNPVMGGMVTNLSDEDIRNVAEFFARKTMKPGSAKAGKASIELGQKIYRGGIAEKSVAACAGCHGPTGAGIPAQFPRLGGQHTDYTEAQLVAFRAGARKNSAQMVSIAARLSDVEIKAVSDYIAGLK